MGLKQIALYEVRGGRVFAENTDVQGIFNIWHKHTRIILRESERTRAKVSSNYSSEQRIVMQQRQVILGWKIITKERGEAVEKTFDSN